MRRIVTATFVSLDGIMQAPGGPEEDRRGGFAFGGWTAPYWDDAIGAAQSEVFSAPFDLLLGRRTYDIFAAHWPYMKFDPKAGDFDALVQQITDSFNSATKYVATHSPETLSWQNSQALGSDVAGALGKLKQGDGPTLLVQGSSDLIQQLLAADLIDEMRLLIYPVVLGRGKRLFSDGAAPGAFKLVKSTIAPSGVIIATYVRDGDVKTGSFVSENPSPAELERRSRLSQ